MLKGLSHSGPPADGPRPVGPIRPAAADAILGLVSSRSALSVLLSLLITAPAAAQVRAIPAEAGTAPVTPFAAFAPSLISPALSLSAPSLAPGLGLASPALTPLPLAAGALAAGALAAAPLAAASVSPLAVSLAAAPASALADLPAPAAALRTPFTPRAATRDLPRARTTDGEANLDALFDGRRGAAALEAPAAPEERPSSAGPALKPRRAHRAWRVAAVAVPAIAAAAILGAATPHLALVALHWIGQGAYWLANPFAFAFTLPQIHRMLSRRSADVSTSMVTVGLLATLVMTVNFAFDGKELMMYRNLAQAAGFAVMLLLKSRFARTPSAAPPSKRRAALETAGAALAMLAVLALAGPALAAAVPAIAAMSALLVPFQVVSGFGFTYMMYAQLSKMRREHSAGDSSAGMMWAYLGTKTIWVWSFATMLALSTAPAWLTLSAGALFAVLCWFAGKAALSRLRHD